MFDKPVDFRKIMTVIIISMIGYAIWIAFAEYDSVLEAMSSIMLSDLAIIIALTLANYVLRFFRWHWYLKIMNYSVPFFQGFIFYIAGFALTATPGKAGEAIRGIYMRPFGVKLRSCVAAVMTERLCDLLSVTFIALIALYYFPNYLWITGVVFAAVGGFLLLVHNPNLAAATGKWIDRMSSDRIKNVSHQVVDMLLDMGKLLGVKALSGGFLLGVVSWGMESFGFYYLVASMDIDAPLLIIMGIYSLSILAGAISFLPGGLGSVELTMGALLLAIGASAGEAASATIICRLVTLWLAVGLGLLALMYLESRKTPANNPIVRRSE